MILPTPNAEEIARFREVHRKQHGTDLSFDEAKATLTRLVQFWYLTGGHDAYEQRLEARKNGTEKQLDDELLNGESE